MAAESAEAVQEALEENKMRRTALTIIFAFAFLASLALASAAVTEVNNIKYGIIEPNGALNKTNTAITNANAIGFICANADCSQTSGSMFSGVLNSGSSSALTLTYPTILQGTGYGIFFYKTGYIPYELIADYAGTGAAPAASDYLTKKRICSVQITDYSASYENGKIKVSAAAQSPISNAGPLNFIPSSILEYYKAVAQLNIAISGPEVSSVVKSLTLPFSATGTETAEFAVNHSGDYLVTITSSTNDAKCLSSESVVKTKTVNVPEAPVIRCHNDIECGGVYPWGSQFCSGKDVVQLFVANTCNNPGTAQSYCSSSNSTSTIKTCSFQCSNGQCINPPSTIELTINSPTVNTVYTGNLIPIDITAVNADNIWFSINNGINQTYANPLTKTFNEGTNTLTAYASNSNGGFASKSVAFTVNLSANQTNLTQKNLFRYGIIENNGDLNKTDVPITNVNLIGFVCDASDCSSVLSPLFNGLVLNSNGNSYMTINFPEILQGSGYGLFFYKSGLIPWEVKSTYAGTGEAPEGIRYLTQKRLCVSPITEFKAEFSNGTITVTSKILSAINNSGPLNYIPSAIGDWYKAITKLNVEITGPQSGNDAKTFSIPYSGAQVSVSAFPATLEGVYAIKATSIPADDKCLNAEESVKTEIITISNETSPIYLTIVSPESKTYSSSKITVKINAVNADNVWFSVNNGANQTYAGSVTKSFPEGTNTLTAYASNAQGSFATASVTFKVDLDSNDGGSSGVNKKRANFTDLEDAPEIRTVPLMYEEESSDSDKIALDAVKKSSRISINAVIITLAILCLLAFILIILLIALGSGNNHARKKPAAPSKQKA